MAKDFTKRLIAILLSAILINLQGTVAVVWAAEAATLDGIEIGPDQVTMHLSKRVRYNSFVTAEPPRLIIELLNTEFAASGKVKKGSGKFLKRVRSAQYQREPNLISRIVLDLEKLVSYRARWDENRLVVVLNNIMANEDEEGVEEEAPAEPDPVVEAPPPPPAPKATPVPAPVPVVAEAPKLRDAAAPSAQPAPEAKLPRRMTTTASSELTRIAMGSDIRPGAAPRVRRARRASAAARKKAKKVRRDILATLPTDPITLDFDDTDIQDILKLMTMKAKVNMVYGSDVSGSLTLHLEDVPFNEAFMTILAMRGLVASQVGQNILRVMTPATLAKERSAAIQQTRVIRLNYVKAAEIKKALDSVRSAEKRTGIINIDAYTNSLIITDSIDGIAAAERLLAELDVRPRQVMIEVKLVEVSLSKDFSIGIEWDYFSIESTKHFGQQGTDIIGSPLVTASGITTATPLSSRPLDDGALPVTGSGTGAGGRGTGIFLPATNVFGAFTYGRVTNNYLLNATLTAAASRGKAKVLSDPKIAAISGETANINITTSIPFVTSETVQGATPTTTEKVSYTITGIQLSVTPTINSDGSITLEVAPQVSQPSTVAASAGSTGAIATDSRSAKTKVHVNDGDTIVIGGLITDTESDSIAKIPFLGDIPILGWLFKKKTTSRSRTELLIFVTSKIVIT